MQLGKCEIATINFRVNISECTVAKAKWSDLSSHYGMDMYVFGINNSGSGEILFENLFHGIN